MTDKFNPKQQSSYFQKGKKHISDIENFLGNCAKFRGLRRHTFSRILKSISFDTIAEIKIYIYMFFFAQKL